MNAAVQDILEKNLLTYADEKNVTKLVISAG
jgi:hypothetical protein